jgi:hypothetical protein
MTYKDVTNSVLKFGGILFTPVQLTAVACYASRPLKVRLSFRSQNVPSPHPKPLKHQYIRRHLVTAHFSQLTNTVLTLLASWLIRFWNCLLYRSLWSSLWVEISTLAYEAKILSWPERLSVAYCTHIIQTKVILKNWRYPQISVFTAAGGLTDLPSCSAGVICRGCGVVTWNTQPSIY